MSRTKQVPGSVSRIRRLVRLEHRSLRLFGDESRVANASVEDLLSTHRGPLRGWRQALIAAVGQQSAAFDVVLEIRFERLQETIFERVILDGNQQLDAAIEIAGHPVSARNEHAAVAAVMEI